MKKLICIIALLLAPAIVSAGDYDNDVMEHNRELEDERDQQNMERRLDELQQQIERDNAQQQIDRIERNQKRMGQQIQEQTDELEQRHYRHR